MTLDIDFPYRVDGGGRTAAVDRPGHVRDLIEQVLFTQPGERVNRPDFGTGLLQLLFAPNSPELAATLQVLVRAALQQWLAQHIVVDDVIVEHDGSTLAVTVRYTLVATQESASASFHRSV